MWYYRPEEQEAVRAVVVAMMAVVVVAVVLMLVPVLVLDTEVVRPGGRFPPAGPQSDGIPQFGPLNSGAEDRASCFPAAGWSLYLD